MLSLNVSDSLLVITFWGKLGVSGMVLMKFLGAFTRSVEDDSLVLGVAKDKSLAGRLEHSNVQYWSQLYLH